MVVFASLYGLLLLWSMGEESDHRSRSSLRTDNLLRPSLGAIGVDHFALSRYVADTRNSAYT